MVAMYYKLLLCSLNCLFFVVSSTSLIDNILHDVDPCEETCQQTYSPHTYEKSLSGECCQRGCRLYRIIELVGKEEGTNGTLQYCLENCHDAYIGNGEKIAACTVGCRSQNPLTDRLGDMTDPVLAQSGMTEMMYPFMYMHDIYSSMVERAKHHMSVSWSFFMQDGNGRLVVIKSQPQIVDLDDEQDFDDFTMYKGTSTGVETNIEASDHTATEVLRRSQIKSARNLGDEINAQVESWSTKTAEPSSSDWLTCIAHKTGIPRLLLCIIILLSAVAMIWLCMSAAVTAPEQKVLQSINGDLEYLRTLAETTKKVHPQDFVEARPLPVKIRVQDI